MWLILIALLLIGIIAIFAALLSASEMAVTAASKTKLHQLAKQGYKRATIVLELQKNMGQLISSILLANTWSMTAMTSIATYVMSVTLGPLGAIITGIIMAMFLTI